MEIPTLQARTKREFEGLPFIPIRYLTDSRKHVTTVIALKGKDGIVLCADYQETSGTSKEIVNKISRIGEDSALGCAGSSSSIELFRECMRENLE